VRGEEKEVEEETCKDWKDLLKLLKSVNFGKGRRGDGEGNTSSDTPNERTPRRGFLMSSALIWRLR